MEDTAVTESQGLQVDQIIDAELDGAHKEKPIVVDDDIIHNTGDAPPTVAVAQNIASIDEERPISSPPLSGITGEHFEPVSNGSHVAGATQPEDSSAVVEAPTSKRAPPTPPAKSPKLHPVRGSTDIPQSQPATPSIPAKTNGHDEHRPQTPSSAHSPSYATSHKRSITISKGYTVSIVLISSALETILASKEAKRSTPLRESAQKALEMIRAGEGGDRPREIFEPLRLACETRSEKLMIASLDCISKLISYSFFAEPSSAQALSSPPPSPHLQGRSSISGASHSSLPQPSLVDLVVHTITTCHSETTPETVSLQVVKALLSLVLSPTIYVHHSSLLKAVRTVYNVFLLSTDAVNQMVAQGGLTQMVHHIFTRCSSPDGASPRSHVSDTLASVPSPRLSKIDIPNPSFAVALDAETSTAEPLSSEHVAELSSHPGPPTTIPALPAHDPDAPSGETSSPAP
jgi:brefeldin A-inhibited guanine nucleotide-exchange protein